MEFNSGFKGLISLHRSISF